MGLYCSSTSYRKMRADEEGQSKGAQLARRDLGNRRGADERFLRRKSQKARSSRRLLTRPAWCSTRPASISVRLR